MNMIRSTEVSEGTGVAVRERVMRLVGAPLFAVLMAVGASLYIPLPFTPVPITLQTFVLYVGAALLGRHYAGQMVGWYLGLGALGAPMFAGGAAGLAVIAGPTGGYLIGFLGAALAIGYLAPRARCWWHLLLVYGLASLLIYSCGVTWLAITLGRGLREGLVLGCYPFLLGDITKIIVATATITGTRRKFSTFLPF